MQILEKPTTLSGLNDELEMLQYISSANIACGGHAGSDEAMSE